MRAWWDVLDVDKDADQRTIKRAYAKKLKTIRQDENPAEFMELRDAYDTALSDIRPNAPLPQFIVQSEPSPTPPSNVPETAIEASPPDRIDKIINEELVQSAPRPQTGPTPLETF